nr:acylneuraminate cytidylyltransferase family protein [uncultured Methanoregula sp.]
MRHVLGFIPARGGSKGIQKKNIKLLGGKPLIEWTVETALRSRMINRLVLSTDSKEIIEVVEKFDIEIPFIRPPHLAYDDTPMIDVIKHCIDFFNNELGYTFDAIVLLQPTAPFREIDDIETAINIFFKTKASSVVSVSKVPGHYNPNWQLKINDSGLVVTYFDKELTTLPSRRQNLSDTYYRNGQFYVINPKNITEANNIYGDHVFPIITSEKVNIDTLNDFHYAEFLLKQVGFNEKKS